jgi:hypothetical protein
MCFSDPGIYVYLYVCMYVLCMCVCTCCTWVFESLRWNAIPATREVASTCTHTHTHTHTGTICMYTYAPTGPDLAAGIFVLA